jgi:hypothetical protein
MMKRKISTTNLILPSILFILPALLHAQPGFTDDVNDVPVDGGLSLLIAGGVGYGIRKLKNKKANRIFKTH